MRLRRRRARGGRDAAKDDQHAMKSRASFPRGLDRTIAARRPVGAAWLDNGGPIRK
jgi:hypothetical protein